MILELAAVMALARECAPDVAPETIAAIAHVESRFNPYAIGVNRSAGLTRQPSSRAEAIQVARSLLARGKNIDLGIGQINSSNMGWLGLSVEDAFDPCRNLTAASKVLTSNYQSVAPGASSPQHALRVSVSMYNTGSQSRGFGNGYVRKVENAAARLFGGGVASRALTAAEVQPALAISPADAAEARADALLGTAPEAPAPARPSAPSWDVFARASGAGEANPASRSVHVFGGGVQ